MAAPDAPRWSTAPASATPAPKLLAAACRSLVAPAEPDPAQDAAPARTDDPPADNTAPASATPAPKLLAAACRSLVAPASATPDPELLAAACRSLVAPASATPDPELLPAALRSIVAPADPDPTPAAAPAAMFCGADDAAAIRGRRTRSAMSVPDQRRAIGKGVRGGQVVQRSDVTK
jgi:hypothetical protein